MFGLKRTHRSPAQDTTSREEFTNVLGLGQHFEIVVSDGVVTALHQEWRITKGPSWTLQHSSWSQPRALDPLTLSATVRGLVS